MNSDKNSRTARVVMQPETHLAMLRGTRLLVDAIRPTFGPIPRFVAVERSQRTRAPELLDDAATIARRVIRVPDLDADMGVMLLRQMLWTLREKVGDGGATAAILFQEVFAQGVKYVVAGGNAPQLRLYLENGLREILDQLRAMTTQVEDRESLARIAEMACHDSMLAGLLGEIIDIVGPFGDVDVRSSYGGAHRREYIRGSHWPGGLSSLEGFLPPGAMRVDLVEPSILISDLPVSTAEDLAPALRAAVDARARSLVVVASSFADQALALFHASRAHPRGLTAIPVKLPEGSPDDLPTTFTDMTMLLGGRALVGAAGDSLRSVRPEDLGRARTAWADRNFFGVVGGGGDTYALRKHLSSLKAASESANRVDDRNRVRRRIATLTGGSAALWISGTTETETEVRKESVQRTIEAVRAASIGGVIPGGGASLLACREALEAKRKSARNDDERAAYRILVESLEAPARTLLVNAGYRPGSALDELRTIVPTHAFDVVRGEIVNVAQAKLYDATDVQMAAVFSAISTAAIALTVDVLVHHRKPRESLAP